MFHRCPLNALELLRKEQEPPPYISRQKANLAYFPRVSEGISNHTTTVLVRQSGIARFTKWFSLKHIYFFVHTCVFAFAFYVFIRGSSGQFVKSILSLAANKTDLSELSPKSSLTISVLWVLAAFEFGIVRSDSLLTGPTCGLPPQLVMSLEVFYNLFLITWIVLKVWPLLGRKISVCQPVAVAHRIDAQELRKKPYYKPTTTSGEWGYDKRLMIVSWSFWVKRGM